MSLKDELDSLRCRCRGENASRISQQVLVKHLLCAGPDPCTGDTVAGKVVPWNSRSAGESDSEHINKPS